MLHNRECTKRSKKGGKRAPFSFTFRLGSKGGVLEQAEKVFFVKFCSTRLLTRLPTVVSPRAQAWCGPASSFAIHAEHNDMLKLCVDEVESVLDVLVSRLDRRSSILPPIPLPVGHGTEF
jgi:hypothetical protein